jgi:hypothetical protein
MKNDPFSNEKGPYIKILPIKKPIGFEVSSYKWTKAYNMYICICMDWNSFNTNYTFDIVNFDPIIKRLYDNFISEDIEFDCEKLAELIRYELIKLWIYKINLSIFVLNLKQI